MNIYLTLKKLLVPIIILLAAISSNTIPRITLLYLIFFYAFLTGLEPDGEIRQASLENSFRLGRNMVLFYILIFLIKYVRKGSVSLEWVDYQYWGRQFWIGSAISLSLGMIGVWISDYLFKKGKLRILYLFIIEASFYGIGIFIKNTDLFKMCFFILCYIMVFLLGACYQKVSIKNGIYLGAANMLLLFCLTAISPFRKYYIFFFVACVSFFFIFIFSRPFIEKSRSKKIMSLGLNITSQDISFFLLLGLLFIQNTVWTALGFDNLEGAFFCIGLLFRYIVVIAMILFVRKITLRCPKSPWSMLAYIYVLITPLVCMCITEITYNKWFYRIYLVPGIINLLLYIMVFLILIVLFGKIRNAMVVNYILSFLWGLLNSYLIRFKNSPFIPSDISAAKTGLSVAAHYDYSLDKQNYIGLILLIISIIGAVVIGRLCSMHFKGALKRTLVIALTAVISFIAFFFVDGEKFVVKDGYFWWLPQNTYYNNGSLFSFMVYSQLLRIKAPEGYSSKQADAILQEYELESSVKEASLPNLIVVMNEAYSDLKSVGDFETTDEYMPYWDSLEENVIKGNMYVSVFGNYTANTEFEFLSGNTMAFYPNDSVPYQQYIREPLNNTLVSLLNEKGYVCHAVHPYGRTGWNRPNVYNYMGFKDYISAEGFEMPEYIRNLISDSSSYKKDIELFEARDKEKPIFIFNVTVQNHGGYWEDTIPDNGIYLEGLSKEYKNVENYLSLIKESDKALKELIEYFKMINEPTIIVMFGDHQPGIENSFYEEIFQKEIDEWELKDWQRKYQVPYFIWANYDIDETEMDISTNYLYPLTLKAMGAQGDSYSRFLLALQEHIPIINANGFMDSQGNWYDLEDSSIPEELKEWINKYRYVQYQMMFDS